MPATKTIKVISPLKKTATDNAVVAKTPEKSTTKIKKTIKDGQIIITGENVTKTEVKKKKKKPGVASQTSLLQSSSKFAIPAEAMERLIREIAEKEVEKATELFPLQAGDKYDPTGLRFAPDAILALHTGAENLILDLFSITNLSTKATSREIGINNTSIINTIFTNDQFKELRTLGLYIRWINSIMLRQEALEITRHLKQTTKGKSEKTVKGKRKGEKEEEDDDDEEDELARRSVKKRKVESTKKVQKKPLPVPRKKRNQEEEQDKEAEEQEKEQEETVQPPQEQDGNREEGEIVANGAAEVQEEAEQEPQETQD